MLFEQTISPLPFFALVSFGYFIHIGEYQALFPFTSLYSKTCVNEPISLKGTLCNQQEPFHLRRDLWTSTCCFTIVFTVTTIVYLKNLCHATIFAKFLCETQLMSVVGAEATSVSICFRFLAMKIMHYHSSPVDTFISWKSRKTHLRLFNFSKFSRDLPPDVTLHMKRGLMVIFKKHI